jgi:hypothetical protein
VRGARLLCASAADGSGERDAASTSTASNNKAYGLRTD